MSAVVENAAFMKKLIAPTDITLIRPFSMGTAFSWLRSTGVAKYPDFAGVTSLSSWPPKFASCVVRSGGATPVAFRAPWSANPIDREDRIKNTIDAARMNRLTEDRMLYVSVRFTF